jgi:hypothetical protein
MKFNCKLLLCATFALSIVLITNNAQAQHKHKHPHTKKKVIQHKKAKVAHKVAHRKSLGQSIKVIKRTNHVIVSANRSVKQNKNHTGDLSRAVHHQQYAKSLLKRHKAHSAMQHSRLARKYAFKAIKANKGNLNKEYQFDADENNVMGETISDDELGKQLMKDKPNVKFDDTTISDKEMTELEILDIDPADYKNN